MTKPGRNDPCPCGSGKKSKRCCGSVVVSLGRGSPEERAAALHRRDRELNEILYESWLDTEIPALVPEERFDVGILRRELGLP